MVIVKFKISRLQSTELVLHLFKHICTIVRKRNKAF